MNEIDSVKLKYKALIYLDRNMDTVWEAALNGNELLKPDKLKIPGLIRASLVEVKEHTKEIYIKVRTRKGVWIQKYKFKSFGPKITRLSISTNRSLEFTIEVAVPTFFTIAAVLALSRPLFAALISGEITDVRLLIGLPILFFLILYILVKKVIKYLYNRKIGKVEPVLKNYEPRNITDEHESDRRTILTAQYVSSEDFGGVTENIITAEIVV
eukprot:snap_masked-scaffold_16-processed-gene-2.30-mRNA-1 protein AED:1.00 eAED:1.00 QI:0/0/0/0/1/1/2/0/212